MDVLTHYGIPGMKWGRRKSSSSTTGIKRKKKIKDMSDDELKKINTRLQLEKQYKDLTKKEKVKGKKFVEDILTNAAKTTATAFATKALTEGVKQIIKSKAG